MLDLNLRFIIQTNFDNPEIPKNIKRQLLFWISSRYLLFDFDWFIVMFQHLQIGFYVSYSSLVLPYLRLLP